MSKIGIRWGWFLGIAICGSSIWSTNCAFAQIIPDGTLPNNSSVTKDGNIFNITGGTQAGSNLFHSFQEFSVPNGSTAFFNNAVDIQNIISRVTGGSASNIDGIIRTNPTANLFLINPNGIVFGQNAQLNVGGSFVASTANAIAFGNQGFFSASNPESSSSLLTVNPSALLFNQIKTASIENNSIATGLRVPDGKSLLLVGGDINMDGGGLFAFGGRVELGGLAGAGTVGLNGDANNLSLSFPDSVERSDVSLSNGAGLNVTAGDGGNIAVNARNLAMTDGSFLFAGIESGLGSDNSKAGNIEVNATGAINLNNGSSINNSVLAQANGQGGNISFSASILQVKKGSRVSTNTLGKGKGGNLAIDAQDVQVVGTSDDGRFCSALAAQTNLNSTGDAGDLTIKTNTLLVRDGAQVSASTFSEGKGGNLSVDAQDVKLIGGTADERFISGLGNQASSTGNAGNLTIKTNTLLMQDGASVTTTTFGQGKGGNLSVNAQDVKLIGRSADGQFGSGLFASTESNSTGDGGNLTIKTNTLLVRDGAQVSASTNGEGKGGNLSIDAKDMQVIGRSALAADANSNSTGNAGDLTIKTNTLLVRDGAQVSASTNGEGKGGNLTVDAQDVQVIGRSGDGLFGSSGLFTSAEPNSTGNAGDLTIKTNTLLVEDGADVSADTFSAGKGGNLTVNAQDVQLIGTSVDGRFVTNLNAQANSNSTGNAGDLTIKTNTLLVRDGAVVSTATFGQGKGGNLTVDAQDVQVIGTSADSRFASGLFASAQPNSTGNAGDITIKTNTLLVRDGAQVSTGTFSAGKGGNLTVDAQDVQLIGTSADSQFTSSLVASTVPNLTGDAGNLTIKTNTLLVRDGAQVITSTFSTGKGGNLTVDAQDVQLIGESADGLYSSGLFASAVSNSTGDSGDLTVKTNSLLVQDGSAITVESLGIGTAGNMTLNARFIRLNNNALLSGNTQSSKVDPNREQATININSQDLIMSRNSNIRTNARGENVIGGNINIDTDFLIGFKNSDISANSANFRGGNVRINAQGIFGIQFRDVASDKTSDITATGASSDLSGNVEINTPDVDPNSGLVNLPTIPVDTQVAQTCTAGSAVAKSSFTITGRGGLPPNPGEALNTNAVQVDLVTLNPNGDRSFVPSKTTTPAPEPIIEATGLALNQKGEVVLTANLPINTPHSPWLKPASCKAIPNS
ncbi:two-partner secretion domain-containing protein [Nostoc sp.]